MVGKLIKNELKAGFHSILPIYIVAAVTTGLLTISFGFDIDWLLVISIILLCLVTAAMFMVTFISVINNFNKSMFRDQGYLTFTLPVTSGQLLFAKAFCSFLWVLLSYVTVFAIWTGLFIYMVKEVVGNIKDGLEEVFGDLGILGQILNDYVQEFDIKGIVSTLLEAFVFFAIYFFVAWIVLYIAGIFFSVSLSNVRPFQKMGFASTILISLVVLVSTLVISTLFMFFFPLTLSFTFDLEAMKLGMELALVSVENAAENTDAFFIFPVGNIVFALPVTAFFFVMTAWFMNHKINLK